MALENGDISMSRELISASKQSPDRSQRKEGHPLLPWLGALPMLNWSYTRAEIYVEDDDHARIRAERLSFEDGRLVSEQFQGYVDPRAFWQATETIHRQMIEAMRPWLDPFALFLPRRKGDN
jgi:hypothetical protein